MLKDKGTREMSVTVGAAQIESLRGDVRDNLDRHIRLVAVAAAHDVQLLVFPELSLTGYELDLADALAFSERDDRLAPLRDAAAEHGVTLVVGAPIRLASGLHIGAFIVGADGREAIYTKRHLGGDELDVFDPAERDPLTRIGHDVAAVAICADTNHASHPRSAAARGATLYLAGVLFSPAEFESVSEKLSGYAREHSMAVVLANHGAPSTTLDTAGGSSIWSEGGELVARLSGVGSGLVIATRTRSGWMGTKIRGAGG